MRVSGSWQAEGGRVGSAWQFFKPVAPVVRRTRSVSFNTGEICWSSAGENVIASNGATVLAGAGASRANGPRPGRGPPPPRGGREGTRRALPRPFQRFRVDEVRDRVDHGDTELLRGVLVGTRGAVRPNDPPGKEIRHALALFRYVGGVDVIEGAVLSNNHNDVLDGAGRRDRSRGVTVRGGGCRSRERACQERANRHQ